jgi:hypothetical protein
VALGQGVEAHQQHGAGGGLVQRLADPNRMAHQDVALELLNLIGRDDAVFEGTEPGGDAVNHLASLDE